MPIMSAAQMEPGYHDGGYGGDELDMDMAAACEGGFEFDAGEFDTF